MQIDVLLTEAELSEQFTRALDTRVFSEKFFYWTPQSIHSWLDLCQGGGYRSYLRSFQLVFANAVEIASQLPLSVQVISVACGQGNKDLHLLYSIRGSGRKVSYVGIDSSMALLEMACHGASESGIATHGLKADITSDLRLQLESMESPDVSRLFVLLGNTLGAFSPVELCRTVSQWMRPGDYLLADGELQAGDTMAIYENSQYLRFVFAPLESAGIREADGQLQIDMKEDAKRSGLFYLNRVFLAEQDFDLHLGDHIVSVTKGERLNMNHSCVYSREAFSQIVRFDAGLQPQRAFLSEDLRFMLALARKA